jgi:hypothetical protein
MHDGDELVVPQCHVASIATQAPAVWAALRMHFDRLFVLSAGQGVLAAATDVISAGQGGVVACLSCAGLTEGFEHLAAQWAGAHAGASMEAARECVASAFSIAIEVTLDDRGNSRVSRVAQLSADGSCKDIFRFAQGGADGGFSATGFTPRVVEEAARRGITLDVSGLRGN